MATINERRTWLRVVLLIWVAALAMSCGDEGTKGNGNGGGATEKTPLRVSIPPYVDTSFVMVGNKLGYFSEERISIDPVDSAWDSQYDLLSGGKLDIAWSTLDEFVNKDRNLRLSGNRVRYFLFGWQFRGLAFYTTKSVTPFAEFEQNAKYSTAIEKKNAFLAQFSKKSIVLPEGSVWEQALRTFVQGTDHPVDSLSIVHASPDAALASLSDSSVGMVAVGSQERFEAEKRGYLEAIAPEALGLDVLTGFVVRDSVYQARRDDILAFARAWYKSANAVTNDKKKAYDITNPYLVGRSSPSLTFDQYQALRAYNVLPTTPADSRSLFLDPSGRGYWKTTWNRSLAALRAAGKAAEGPPDEDGFAAAELNAQMLKAPPK